MIKKYNIKAFKFVQTAQERNYLLGILINTRITNSLKKLPSRLMTVYYVGRKFLSIRSHLRIQVHQKIRFPIRTRRKTRREVEFVGKTSLEVTEVFW